MATKEVLASLIGNTEFFAEVDADDRAAVVEAMRETKFQSGQVIFTRGDEGRDVYLVADGRVRLSVLTAEGRELSFAHAEKGALFGEIAMLDGGPRTADATAVTAVTAYTLSRAAFHRLIETQPAINDAMVHFLCKRIREADQQLEAIALCPIEQRLARFFIANIRAKDADIDSGDVELPLKMSQSELALLIGASRPKVNTALSMLEASGALKRNKDSIVCNVEELELIAGMD